MASESFPTFRLWAFAASLTVAVNLARCYPFAPMASPTASKKRRAVRARARQRPRGGHHDVRDQYRHRSSAMPFLMRQGAAFSAPGENSARWRNLPPTREVNHVVNPTVSAIAAWARQFLRHALADRCLTARWASCYSHLGSPFCGVPMSDFNGRSLEDAARPRSRRPSPKCLIARKFRKKSPASRLWKCASATVAASIRRAMSRAIAGWGPTGSDNGKGAWVYRRKTFRHGPGAVLKLPVGEASLPPSRRARARSNSKGMAWNRASRRSPANDPAQRERAHGGRARRVVAEMLMALYRSAEIRQVVSFPSPELETYVPPVARH